MGNGDFSGLLCAVYNDVGEKADGCSRCGADGGDPDLRSDFVDAKEAQDNFALPRFGVGIGEAGTKSLENVRPEFCSVDEEEAREESEQTTLDDQF